MLVWLSCKKVCYRNRLNTRCMFDKYRLTINTTRHILLQVLDLLAWLSCKKACYRNRLNIRCLFDKYRLTITTTRHVYQVDTVCYTWAVAAWSAHTGTVQVETGH